ncbi:MAG: NF041680 family putative transposase, partial [Trebonia sp.]
AGGRPVKHGNPVRCADPATWGSPDCEHDGTQARHGPVRATAWNRVHQMIHKNCGGWEDWDGGAYPVIEGTLIRLRVLRGGCEPMWLWASVPDPGEDLVRSLWACYLRRFDLEHMFRFLKQALGWTRPRLRDPAAADRWTWLLLACCAQLYLARGLASLTRMPWHPRRPAAGILTPGQVRAGFPRVRETLPALASTKKPSVPGPGRPQGSRNKRKAPRYPVGKTSPKTRRAEDGTRKRVKRTG